MLVILIFIFGIFEYIDGKYVKYCDFGFDTIENLILILNSLKKKIFFVGNCGILYKDVIQSYLKNNIYFCEDILVSSKYIGQAGFDKYLQGETKTPFELSALYLKKSSAEEKLKL